MREPPPTELVELLERLGLATAAQVQGVARRAWRLTQDRPVFESAWVDALAQARIVTPFQANEINGGRGAALRVGPYLLCEQLCASALGSHYRACDVESGRQVRLITASVAGDMRSVEQRLSALIESGRNISGDDLAWAEQAGVSNGRAWAACAWLPHGSADDWLKRHGRMSPDAVLEIARQMLIALAALERAGHLHGDLRATNVLLADAGQVVLLAPGWRNAVRPDEVFLHRSDSPEVYDGLAPERIAERAGISTATEIYATACLWWQLLTGRPALAGGDSLTRRQAAQAAKICDVRRYAFDAPDVLAAAISACTQGDPRRRPESFARLAAMLGPPTRQGEQALAAMLAGRRPRSARRWSMARMQRSPTTAAAVIITCSILGMAGYGIEVVGRHAGPAASVETSSEVVQLSAAVTPPAATSTPAVASSSQPAAPPRKPAGNDLLLPSGQPIHISSLELAPGQTVRGENGGRVTLMIDAGLQIIGREARFENVDFIWSPTDGQQPAGSQGAPRALLHLSAALAEFRGCTFSADKSTVAPVGIEWMGASSAAVELPTGRVQFANCLFQGVAAVVNFRATGALVIEAANTLHLGRGPLVRLNRAARPDEPLLVGLHRFTHRDAGPLVECTFAQQPQEPGKLTVRATDCAFWPGEKQPLLLFIGPEAPDRLLHSLTWSGSGSVLAPQAPLAAWRQPSGAVVPASEEVLEVAGLVRSGIEFAGRLDAGPAASKIVRWQAPLNSSDPPGADPNLLPRTTIPAAADAGRLGSRPPADAAQGTKR